MNDTSYHRDVHPPPDVWQVGPCEVTGIGLPADAMEGKLDELYVERLIQLVRGSSLGTVVILAHDGVYAEDGRKLDGVGSFYVPNDYILSLARKYRAFLPAVSIHPARPDSMKELERCLPTAPS